MARLGVSKKKKSPHATELSQLKKEVQRLTKELETCKRELAEATERETGHRRNPARHRQLADRNPASAGRGRGECAPSCAMQSTA